MCQLFYFPFRWILAQGTKNIPNLTDLDFSIPSVVKQVECLLEFFFMNTGL